MGAGEIRVDWFRLLVQLGAEGYSLYAVSHFTAIPKSTLIGYKQGAQPSYHNGCLLLRFWSQSCGQDQDQAPTISPFDFRA